MFKWFSSRLLACWIHWVVSSNIFDVCIDGFAFFTLTDCMYLTLRSRACFKSTSLFLFFVIAPWMWGFHIVDYLQWAFLNPWNKCCISSLGFGLRASYPKWNVFEYRFKHCMTCNWHNLTSLCLQCNITIFPKGTCDNTFLDGLLVLC